MPNKTILVAIGTVAAAIVAALYGLEVIDATLAEWLGGMVLAATGVSVVVKHKAAKTAIIALCIFGLSGCAQSSWGPYGSGANVGAAVGTYIKVRGGLEPGLEVQTGADQVADANHVEVRIGDKTLIMKGVHFANNASEPRRAAALQAEKVPAILDAQGRIVEIVGEIPGKIAVAGGQLIGAYSAGQTQIIGAKANAAVSIIDVVSVKLAQRIKERLAQAVQAEADRILPEPPPTTQPVE